MIIVVMGVSGSGKTTVGSRLAHELQWKFADADNFHPPSNVDKMSAGIPLTDKDRLPWLMSIHEYIENLQNCGENGVITCSALKAWYRHLLINGQIHSSHSMYESPGKYFQSPSKPINENTTSQFKTQRTDSSHNKTEDAYQSDNTGSMILVKSGKMSNKSEALFKNEDLLVTNKDSKEKMLALQKSECTGINSTASDELQHYSVDECSTQLSNQSIIKEIMFVYLKGSKTLLEERIKNRQGHFMPPALLQSQLDTLEEPEECGILTLTFDIALSVEKIVSEIVQYINKSNV